MLTVPQRYRQTDVFGLEVYFFGGAWHSWGSVVWGASRCAISANIEIYRQGKEYSPTASPFPQKKKIPHKSLQTEKISLYLQSRVSWYRFAILGQPADRSSNRCGSKSTQLHSPQSTHLPQHVLGSCAAL